MSITFYMSHTIGKRQCLCTLVETGPKGISPAYRHCSEGYVKGWYDQLFERSVATIEGPKMILDYQYRTIEFFEGVKFHKLKSNPE